MFFRFVFALFLMLSFSVVSGAENGTVFDGEDADEESLDFVENEEEVSEPEPKGEITKFEKKFLVRFLCNYNFVSFWSSEVHQRTLLSNRPVDVGLGFGYRDFYWDFLYALDFTADEKSRSAAFEIGFDFFPGDWWIKAKYRRYSGFTMNDDNETFVDFWERDEYISALWMATADGEFSPMVAYFLDRKQTKSAGSLIVGGRLQETGAIDYSKTLEYYEEKKEFISTWVNMGYSFTWIYSNDMFLNVWGVAGLAVGGEEATNDAVFMPDVVGKMAWGQVGEVWSWNCVMEAEYMPVVFEDHSEQKWVSAFKILVVRRF